jgi:hypothetical protein
VNRIDPGDPQEIVFGDFCFAENSKFLMVVITKYETGQDEKEGYGNRPDIVPIG